MHERAVADDEGLKIDPEARMRCQQRKRVVQTASQRAEQVIQCCCDATLMLARGGDGGEKVVELRSEKVDLLRDAASRGNRTRG